jgi:bile acid-coenzyme A ligase
MSKFDPAYALDLIERHRVNWLFLAPTMLRRMLRVPGIERRNLSSLQAVYHAGAPTPDWLREAWIDLIGAERMHEAFGATEAVGFVSIRGDEWLEHRGSVGRPRRTELRILDEQGCPVGTGVTGEIFMRPSEPDQPTYRYLGAPAARTTSDGFTSVGDLGWLDEEGYLYVADRRVDLILSGGANIYPAEVEAALSAHPLVADVAVVGLPDDDWGQRVHAIIQLADGSTPPSTAELDAFCRARLASYKRPKTYEFVGRLCRSESAKLRRSQLIAERQDAAATRPTMTP